MKTVSTRLVESNSLVREGLKALLGKTNFRIIEDSESPPDNPDSADLFILGVNESDADSALFVSNARSFYPSGRIAVLSSGTKPELVEACLSGGIDGYLSWNLPQESLLNALNMIMAGEKIYPAAALESLLNKRKKSGREADHNLSDRELEILRHVADGKTNKEIALHRNIAESTVKAHIKTILRKLKLSNRTQAARWAFNEGIAEYSIAENQFRL